MVYEKHDGPAVDIKQHIVVLQIQESLLHRLHTDDGLCVNFNSSVNSTSSVE